MEAIICRGGGRCACGGRGWRGSSAGHHAGQDHPRDGGSGATGGSGGAGVRAGGDKDGERVVRAVHVKPGEDVEKDQVLVEIE